MSKQGVYPPSLKRTRGIDMRVGIISDTHGLLRPEVIHRLQGCSLILHGGDIGGQELLHELERIAPVKAVRGNNDKEWAEHIPLWEKLEICGVPVFMCHKKKDIPAGLRNVKLAIYGHSHKYADGREQGIRFLNPGSCGPRRFNQEISMALMEISKNGDFRIEQVVIPHTGAAMLIPKAEADRERIVRGVIRGIEKGMGTKAIAEKNHISAEFAEEVSRMYLTHPGIDVDGILNRLHDTRR